MDAPALIHLWEATKLGLWLLEAHAGGLLNFWKAVKCLAAWGKGLGCWRKPLGPVLVSMENGAQYGPIVGATVPVAVLRQVQGRGLAPSRSRAMSLGFT